MSPDRVVKTTLIIDEHGAVRAVRSVADESSRTAGHLGKLEKSVHGLGRSFGGLKNMIGFGLGGLGVGGLAFGLSDIARKTKEVATETEKFHTITGIGAQSSLYYTQALKARGLSGEAVTKAFGFLAKNLKSAELQEQKFALTQGKAAAKGKASTAILGRQATAFKELGIDLAQFNRLTEAQKLEKITKAFEAMAPGMRKTRLERELFGRGGNQLSIVLEKNNLGLSHQIALVKKFFPTIKGGANSMKELLEKQAESKMAWEGLELTLGEKLIPVMTSVFSWFSKVTLEVERGKGTWGELASAVSGVVGFFRGIWKAFEGIVGPAKAVKFAVAGIVGVMVASKVAAFGSAMLGLGKNVALGLSFLTPEVAALTLAVAGVYEAVKHAEEIREFFGLGGTKTTYKGPTGKPTTKQAIEREEVKEYLKKPGQLIHELRYQQAHHEKPDVGEEVAIRQYAGHVNAQAQAKIDLHMDGAKLAEALLHNPKSRRFITETAGKYALEMAARR